MSKTALTGVSFLSAVEPDLSRVRAGLRDLWRDLPDSIRPLVQYGALDRGKLLRPALLLLWGRVFGVITHDHVRAATMLELLHNASLLHDDVLDGGYLRRGMPTVNHRWGNRMAVVLQRLRDYADDALDALRHVPQTPVKAALQDVPRWIMQEVTEGAIIVDCGFRIGDSHNGVPVQSPIRNSSQ